MIVRHWLGYSVAAALVTAASLPLGCGSTAGVKLQASGGDGGSVETTDGGSPGTGPTDEAGATSCAPAASACQTSSECCTGLCLGNQCVSSVGACAGGGGSCKVGTDCCTGACVNGACSASQCLTLGASCPVTGDECCTNTCVGGACAPIGGAGGSTDGGKTGGSSCMTAGNACTASSECCSGLCTNGTCNLASSYCTQTNDICYQANDCCTGICSAPNGSPVSSTNPGTCGLPPSSGGVNCTGVDGTLCDPTQLGCAGGCCSHLCAPFGPTGVAICQQAQGCHVEGDLCRVNADCCGGESPDAGVLGGGLVVCSTSVNGGTIGVCMTPTGSSGGGNTCVPEGDVCHYTGAGYACSSSSARADCCGSQTPKFTACRLDKLGVPRCLAYGLDDAGADACRATGDTCAAASDCCDGQPCVPNAQGELTCAAAACIPSGGACTSSADCCAGITCVAPPGAQQGTCATVAPPPAGDGGGATPGPDSGASTPDGGTSGNPGGGLGCASFGQSCASLGCCTDLACTGSTCLLPPK